MKQCLAALVLLTLGGCAAIVSLADPPTVVPSVDLTRYVGKWYEIAH
jgi:lipocalin